MSYAIDVMADEVDEQKHDDETFEIRVQEDVHEMCVTVTLVDVGSGRTSAVDVPGGFLGDTEAIAESVVSELLEEIRTNTLGRLEKDMYR